MLKSFIYRGSQPQPMAQPNPKRISTPAGHRLSVIMEGAGAGTAAGAGGRGASSSGEATATAEAVADSRGESGRSEAEPEPVRPAIRITNSFYEQRVHHGDPPLFGEEKKPPSYVSGKHSNGDDERHRGGSSARPYSLLPAGMRENMQQRGGWKRLILIVAVVLAVVLAIALGVGLGVGLSKHHNSSSSSSSSSSGASPSPSPSPPSQPFPLGTWAFETYLTSVSTACTSNSALWTCAPYSTYSSATASSSAYTFSWEIASSSSSAASYTISSTDPFGVRFSNISLALVDANTPQERYTFSLPNTSKQVASVTSLFANGAATVCYYNDTTVQASLYTRMPASAAPSASSTQTMQQSGSMYSMWPYAVQVETLAAGGSGVPSCYMTLNGAPTGQPASLPTESSSAVCSCVYENYNLS